VLPGCHLTPGDLDELRTIIEDFGLEPSFLPDLAGSLDGHIPDEFTPTTIGGLAWKKSRQWATRPGRLRLESKCAGLRKRWRKKPVFPTVSSSVFAAVPNDDFITFLSEISGKPVPMKYRRQRGQLVDAMLDAHFHIGGRKLAIGAEPDLLFDVSSMLHEMGAKVAVAVTTTESPVLARVATDDVLIGD